MARDEQQFCVSRDAFDIGSCHAFVYFVSLWLIDVSNCCPGIVGFREKRIEKWLQFGNLYGFGPDNENQVAVGSRLLQFMSF